MTFERLFGAAHAFDHPITLWLVAVLGAFLLVTPLVFRVLARRGVLGDGRLGAEIWTRYRTWLWLAPLMIGPVLLGAAWLIGAVTLLALACFREFSRATGLFRERVVSAAAVLGILATGFAVLDHWYGMFMALMPLSVAVICAAAVLEDRPKGYIQRVGLGVFGFMLFGAGLGHLGYMANDADYRPIVLTLLVAVEFNDVFGFVVGKSLGHRRLCVNTSPGKTVAGALGALVLTTTLFAVLGRFVFAGSAVAAWPHLVVLGLLVSITGQLGDLMLSSVKRDLGLKDIGNVLPGHGGLLDRFDSLLLAAPTVFHYVGHLRGFGLDQPTRILTGGG